MSDVSKITVGNSTYDIKDSSARGGLSGKVDTSSVGSANGVAALDATGKVPSSQLPSYVDDVVDGYLSPINGKFYADSSFTTEIPGEEGKIYITIDTLKSYRYGGSSLGFVEISESLALGETSSTAYAGNKGKANADAITAIKDGTTIDSFGDVETALAGKVDTVAGKGLSTNDYDDTEKAEVAKVADKADKVTSATAGHLASLDATGNLTDSDSSVSIPHSYRDNPIALTTQSAQVAKSTQIVFEPIQSGSGDPSPSNVRAISGYNEIKINGYGKNLWSAGDISGTGSVIVDVDLIPGNYVISAVCVSSDTDAKHCRIQLKDENGAEIKSAFLGRDTRKSYAFTLAKECTAITFFASDNTAHSSGDTFSVTDIQFEVGDTTSTPYESYQEGISISESLPETVYGGTLDVESGELTVTHKIVDMGTDLSWTYITNDGVFRSNNISDKKPGLSQAYITCEIYKHNAQSYDEMPNYSIKGHSSYGYIFVKDTTYNGDASAFKTAITGKNLAYALAEPYIIRLTSNQVNLLLGSNTITTNGTTINITVSDGDIAKLSDIATANNQLFDRVGSLVSGIDIDKADKDADAVVGNIAVFDASGNPVDSGVDGDISTATATGNPLSFNTKSAQSAKNCVITLNPIQSGSGDPSPSNVRAISGRNSVKLVGCGKNFYELTSSKINVTENCTSTFKNNGVEVSSTGSYGRLDFIIPTEIGKTYTISMKAKKSGDVAGIYFSALNTWQREYGSFGNNILSTDLTEESKIITAISNELYLGVYPNNNGSSITIEDFQIEEGSFEEPIYEPYHTSTDLTLTLPETVYGGTLDVRTGILTVDRGIVDLGDLEYEYNATLAANGIFPFEITTASTLKGSGICEMYKCYSVSSWSGQDDNSIISRASETHSFRVKNSSCTTIEQIKEANTGIKFVYKLDSYYTLQLTPSQVKLLQGANYVSTDGDSIELTYSNGQVATLEDVAEAEEFAKDFVDNKIDVLEHNTIKIKNIFTSGSTDVTTISLSDIDYAYPMFLVAMRRDTLSTNDGTCIIKIHNGVAYISNKNGLPSLTAATFDNNTSNLTLTIGTYMTGTLYGVAK